jgi:hypothetical protein
VERLGVRGDPKSTPGVGGGTNRKLSRDERPTCESLFSLPRADLVLTRREEAARLTS